METASVSVMVTDGYVTGGGITGMMAAFWIKLLHPNIPVTILEKSDRLGGWIQTTKKEFEGQDIPMESGPRTFKSTGTSVAALFDAVSSKTSKS